MNTALFATANMPCAVKSVALKIERVDETDMKVAHVTCAIEPFTPNYARELGDAVYDHLFLKMRGEERPRPEVANVAFNLGCGLQRITARSHWELKPDAELREVRVSGVRVSRPDPNQPRLSLQFILSLSMDRREALSWVVQAFAQVNYLTFESEQMALLDDDLKDLRQAKDRLQRLADADGAKLSVTVDGQTTVLADGRKPKACDHGVLLDGEQVCEACEVKADTLAQQTVESLRRKGSITGAGTQESPAVIQAAAARKGKENRAKKPAGRGWGKR